MTQLADAILHLLYLRKVSRPRHGSHIVIDVLHECGAEKDFKTILALMEKADLSRLSINAMTTMVRTIPFFYDPGDMIMAGPWQKFADSIWDEVEKTRDPAPLFVGMQYTRKTP